MRCNYRLYKRRECAYAYAYARCSCIAFVCLQEEHLHFITEALRKRQEKHARANRNKTCAGGCNFTHRVDSDMYKCTVCESAHVCENNVCLTEVAPSYYECNVTGARKYIVANGATSYTRRSATAPRSRQPRFDPIAAACSFAKVKSLPENLKTLIRALHAHFSTTPAKMGANRSTPDGHVVPRETKNNTGVAFIAALLQLISQKTRTNKGLRVMYYKELPDPEGAYRAAEKELVANHRRMKAVTNYQCDIQLYIAMTPSLQQLLPLTKDVFGPLSDAQPTDDA